MLRDLSMQGREGGGFYGNVLQLAKDVGCSAQHSAQVDVLVLSGDSDLWSREAMEKAEGME